MESPSPPDIEPVTLLATRAKPARIRLLPAREAPYVVVIRRKPSKRFYIVRWSTETGEEEHGSWFKGHIYAHRSDVSFDGQWMVYLARGWKEESWNGVCRLPFLKTEMEGSNDGSWFGGGYWRDRRTLVLNGWQAEKGRIPFKVESRKGWSPEDVELLYSKLERDGWSRAGANYGTERTVRSRRGTSTIREGDDGWRSQPTRKHPVLHVRYVGYSDGYKFRFSLQGSSELLDESVDSACWDSLGQLVFSRLGVVHCFTLNDIATGVPTRSLDLEGLTPPPRQMRAGGEH